MKSVYLESHRPQAEVLERYRALLRYYSPACLVCDGQGRGGALGGGFRPVFPSKVIGPAITVNLDPDDLVDCLPVLGRAAAGDVIIIACHGTASTAMWGGIMSTICKALGIAGAVVDGAIRDVDEICDLRFPVWSRGVIPRASPTAGHGRSEPIQVNVPVIVGGENISAGDIVVADESGVTVVKRELAADVVQRAEAQAQKEDELRERVRGAPNVADIIRTYGHV